MAKIPPLTADQLERQRLDGLTLVQVVNELLREGSVPRRQLLSHILIGRIRNLEANLASAVEAATKPPAKKPATRKKRR